MIYRVILCVTSLFSAYFLARLRRKGYRRIPIFVPLIGTLFSRIILLFVIYFKLPIELMFASAALNGITGSYTTLWASAKAWDSQTTSESDRSLHLISIEMARGMAGMIINLAITFIFAYLNMSSLHGPVLTCGSIACYAFSVLHSIFILRTPDPDEIPTENNTEQNPLMKTSFEDKEEKSTKIDMQQDEESAANGTVNPFSPRYLIIAMVISIILFEIVLKGTHDLIDVYMIREPLKWGSLELFQGNAAYFLTQVTSSLGVMILSNYLSDLHLVIVGISSFCCGVVTMAIVQWTFLYYIARAMMAFSMIPVPILYSAICKHSQGRAHSEIFVVLHLAIEVIAVGSSACFSKLYQLTAAWFPGFYFIIFGAVGLLSMIPVCIAWKYRVPSPSAEETLKGLTGRLTLWWDGHSVEETLVQRWEREWTRKNTQTDAQLVESLCFNISRH
uniref:Uncharacterized protein n=1 Tax=Leptobrachium leishanense TaxID=445787 RepID=A0A8C5QWM3_9ANUR